MNRILIAVVLCLSLFVVASESTTRADGNCWSVYAVHPSTSYTGQVTQVNSDCSWLTGIRVGDTKTATEGTKCNYGVANGAESCAMHLRLLWENSRCDGPGDVDPADCCYLKAIANSIGIGCCSAPCPPTIPACQSN